MWRECTQKTIIYCNHLGLFGLCANLKELVVGLVYCDCDVWF